MRVVTPASDPALFWATAGGMGLTGVVLEATVRLTPIATSRLLVDTERADDLDDVMARMDARDDEYRYSVAWIDCLARGSQLGRSVLMRGDHALRDDLAPERRDRPLVPPRAPRLAAPPWMPDGLLRRSTVSVFNELFFRRAARRSARSV